MPRGDTAGNEPLFFNMLGVGFFGELEGATGFGAFGADGGGAAAGVAEFADAGVLGFEFEVFGVGEGVEGFGGDGRQRLGGHSLWRGWTAGDTRCHSDLFHTILYASSENPTVGGGVFGVLGALDALYLGQ